MPERRVRHEADAEFASKREHLGLRVAGPQRVLGLQRRDRVHGVRPADGVDPGFGQADVADLALGDQLGEGADDLLDRRVRVDPVLVVQVDVVGVEPAQRSFDGDADVLGAAVGPDSAGVRHEPELGGEHHLVAAALEGAADEFLVGVGAVDLGGVDQGDAEVEGPVDGADGFGVVAAGPGVGGGHAHRAQADAADVEGAEV